MKKLNLIKIIVFIVIIIVPIININLKQDQISEIDNRMLMNFEEVYEDAEETQDVFNNFTDYISDRIGFRSEMVTLYTETMDKVFNELVHPNYEYGKEGFIYSKLPETAVNLKFQEIFSTFIKNFENYCNERGIKFLYTLEPNKSTIYPEYLPDGYNRSTDNLDYFTQLLEEKGVNFLSNVDTLLAAKADPLFKDILLYDKKYDAGHWNETGAIVGISAIIDRLNDLDSRVGSFDINRYEAVDAINEKLIVSNFKINEETTHYNLLDDSIIYVDDFENEIYRNENFRYFTHYKNLNNTDAPRLLIFAGSYFNNKEKFITGNFSEVMKIHNYTNVIDYEYYINIYNPDIVLFESTEYTNTGYHYPISLMENKIYKKNLENFTNLKNESFVQVDINDITTTGEKITNYKIPVESEELLYAYAYINDRILDCKIINNEEGNYIEFSIMTSEIENLDNFELYLVNNNEDKYEKININI